MTSIPWNWATVIAVISGLAGVAGTVLTPIYGSNLANSVQAVLMALSGVLVAISGYHATSVVATTAKAKAAIRLNAELAAANGGAHVAGAA